MSLRRSRSRNKTAPDVVPRARAVIRKLPEPTPVSISVDLASGPDSTAYATGGGTSGTVDSAISASVAQAIRNFDLSSLLDRARALDPLAAGEDEIRSWHAESQPAPYGVRRRHAARGISLDSLSLEDVKRVLYYAPVQPEFTTTGIEPTGRRYARQSRATMSGRVEPHSMPSQASYESAAEWSFRVVSYGPRDEPPYQEALTAVLNAAVDSSIRQIARHATEIFLGGVEPMMSFPMFLASGEPLVVIVGTAHAETAAVAYSVHTARPLHATTSSRVGRTDIHSVVGRLFRMLLSDSLPGRSR